MFTFVAVSAASELGDIFRLTTARNPSKDEVNVLVSGLHCQIARLEGDPEATSALPGTGKSLEVGKISGPKMVAYAVMASLARNLDETITRD